MSFSVVIVRQRVHQTILLKLAWLQINAFLHIRQDNLVPRAFSFSWRGWRQDWYHSLFCSRRDKEKASERAKHSCCKQVVVYTGQLSSVDWNIGRWSSYFVMTVDNNEIGIYVDYRWKKTWNHLPVFISSHTLSLSRTLINILMPYNYRTTNYVQLFTITNAIFYTVIHNWKTKLKVNYCYLDINVSEKGSSGRNLVCSEKKRDNMRINFSCGKKLWRWGGVMEFIYYYISPKRGVYKITYRYNLSVVVLNWRH